MLEGGVGSADPAQPGSVGASPKSHALCEAVLIDFLEISEYCTGVAGS